MASSRRSTPIMAAYHTRFGATKNPAGSAMTKTIASSRMAGSVRTPYAIPRSEFFVALKSRFTARRCLLNGRLTAARVAARDGADYSAARYSERSAARLAHQSGGLGVASSNLAAPTILTGRFGVRQRSIDQAAAGDELVERGAQLALGSGARTPGRSGNRKQRLTPLIRTRLRCALTDDVR